MIKDLIRSDLLSRDFRIAYDTLHRQSTISRYLVVPSRRGSGTPIEMSASKFFSPDDIKGFIKDELAILETEAKPHIATILMPPNRISSLISKIKNLF